MKDRKTFLEGYISGLSDAKYPETIDIQNLCDLAKCEGELEGYDTFEKRYAETRKKSRPRRWLFWGLVIAHIVVSVST